MAVNFPLNPVNGDTFSVGTKVYTYDGAKESWERTVATAPQITDARTLQGFDGDHYLDYNNHTNTPNIPTDISDLDDTSSLLFDKQYSSLQGVPSIPTDVADLTDTSNRFNDFDGSYNSLTDTPTLFSGSWNDLQDKPTIPENIPRDVSDLTDNNSVIPIDVSDLTDNDSLLTSGYLSDLTDVDTTNREAGQALVWNEELQKWVPGTVVSDTLTNIDCGRADTDFTSPVILLLDGGNA